jgi:heat shock protein HslJ
MKLPTGALALSFLAAIMLSPFARAEDQPQLTGDWKLVKLGEDEVKAAEPPTLSVTAEGKVAGFAGVNRFFGGLAKDDATKERTLFGPLAMTRKAGPPELSKLEFAYTTALAEVNKFTIEKETLTLLVDDKPKLVFERVKKDDKD